MFPVGITEKKKLSKGSKTISQPEQNRGGDGCPPVLLLRLTVVPTWLGLPFTSCPDPPLTFK